jgi:hypothetical protein
MKNMFVSAMTTEDNRSAFTEKGAMTLKSTLSPVLDLFSRGGAYRSRSAEDVHSLVMKAYATNPIQTILVLFYLRDVRGGQGERRIFREAMAVLSKNYPEKIRPLIPLIATYGRFDDVFWLDESLKEDVIPFIKKTLKEDIASDNPSLLAKWMPSINTSSKASRMAANALAKEMMMSPREYRKTLSGLRKRIGLVETAMSQNQWNEIEYGKVPSRAAMLYRKAFKNHDEARYEAYLEKAVNGEEKINSGVLFPYELMARAMKGEDKTVEAQWRQLPNYVTENQKAMVICDTSGSMCGGWYGNRNPEPIDVAVSLAVYFSERNVGPFKDVWMNFSTNPTFQTLRGDTLFQKWQAMDKDNWSGSTNINKAFDLMLKTAIKHEVPADEMPTTLYIVSDMQFDGSTQLTNFEQICKNYEDAGYDRPNIVFWNVDARNDTSPVTFNEKGVMLVSGCSPSVFKQAITGQTPQKFMEEIIYSERYEPIREVLN